MGSVGGFKRNFKGLFTEIANQLPELDPNNPAHAASVRFRQGIIPDLMTKTRSMRPFENAAKTVGGRTLADMKTLALGAFAFALLFSRFDNLARSELSQVRATNLSGGEGITLLPAIRGSVLRVQIDHPFPLRRETTEAS